MSTPNRLDEAQDRGGASSAFGILRRRWPMALAIVIACVAVSVLHAKRSPKTYEATANVAFQSGTLTESALQLPSGGSTEPQREANTELLIAHSLAVAKGVETALHLDISPGELLEEVEVEVAPTADVLNITASTDDPGYSARLANAFAEQYIAFRANSELAGITRSEEGLQNQIEALPVGSSQRESLEDAKQRLNELRAVSGGGANVIGEATAPSSPSGTSVTTFAIVGLLVGMAVAFLVVLLLESLDRRIRSLDDFEREYRLPSLTVVPQSSFRERRATARGEALEPYRILRSALEFTAVARTLDTLMVTSAISGEGKTTVAIDLSHAIALTGRRTVLVEMDLRRPTFAEHFGLSVQDGFFAALQGGDLDELLVAPIPDLPTLRVLPAGRLPHNPAELLGSPRVTELLGRLSEQADMVIVDAPPLIPVADAQVLLNNGAVHGVVVVARVDRTTRDEVRRTRAILDRHPVQPVGLVVTGLRGGSYGNDYGYSPSKQPAADEAAFDRAALVEPGPEQPVAEEPAPEQPVVEEPAPEQPVAEQPVSDEPVPEQPMPEEPVYEAPEPVCDEPEQEPVHEEPVVYEEPLPEQPVSDESPAEEPAYEEPAYEEPAYDEPEIRRPDWSDSGLDRPGFGIDSSALGRPVAIYG
ncbi:MAG TPA: P-loop NTPase [Solirubrobacteraceae bacterium]